VAQPVLFFALAGDDWSGAERLRDMRAQTHEYRLGFWRPSLSRPFPPGRRDPRILSYSFMHTAGLFETPSYSMVRLSAPDGSIAHSSLIMPRFARFPFMGLDDLQIGATETSPTHRGRGLAVRAIDETIAALGHSGRTFWYLTEDANTASIAVIRKAGFSLVGRGTKVPRFGLTPLGYYAITELSQLFDRGKDDIR